MLISLLARTDKTEPLTIVVVIAEAAGRENVKIINSNLIIACSLLFSGLFISEPRLATQPSSSNFIQIFNLKLMRTHIIDKQ